MVEKVESSIAELRPDNGVEWLNIKPLEGALSGKSAFKLVTVYGFEFFQPTEKSTAEVALKLEGKKVLNSIDVVAQVERRIGLGEVNLGTCPLCFDDMPRDKLLRTCGRSGCNYTVDNACLSHWVCCLVMSFRVYL